MRRLSAMALMWASATSRRIGVAALAGLVLFLAPGAARAQDATPGPAGAAAAAPRIPAAEPAPAVSAPRAAAAPALEAVQRPVARPWIASEPAPRANGMRGLKALLATFALLVLGAVALCAWSWRRMRRRANVGPWVAASRATGPDLPVVPDEDLVEQELQRMIADGLAAAATRRTGSGA